MPEAITNLDTLLRGVYGSIANDEWKELSDWQKSSLDILNQPDYTEIWDRAHEVAYLDCVNEYLQAVKRANPKRKGHGRQEFAKRYFPEIVDLSAFDRWFTEYNPKRHLLTRLKTIRELGDIQIMPEQLSIAFNRAAIRWIRLHILKKTGKKKKWITNTEYLFLRRIHKSGDDVADWHAALPFAEQVKKSVGDYDGLMADWGSSYRVFIRVTCNAD